MKRLPLLILFLFLVTSPLSILAQQADDELDYYLSAPIPGGSNEQSVSSLVEYVELLLPFLLSFAAIAALVMFILGGVQYMTGGISPSQLSAAKERIQNALVGLLLVVSSVLILSTINPELVKLKLNLRNVGECPECDLNRRELAPPRSINDGGGCIASSECRSQLCINRICEPGLLNENSSCTYGQQCRSGVCGGGGASGTICIGGGRGEGQSCQQGGQAQCEAGLICVGSINATCERPGSVEDGDSCSDSAQCKEGSFCGDSWFGNECYRKNSAGEGDVCYGNQHCQTGLVCSNEWGDDHCLTFQTKSRGESCSDDIECQVGLVCDAGSGNRCNF